MKSKRIIQIGIGVLLAFLFAFLFARSRQEGFQDGSPKIVIMALFKNEAMVIREWLEHYKWQGVDHVLLLNNNSTDKWEKEIEGLQSFVTVLPATKDFAQKEHYNTIGKKWLDENGADIVGIFDIDEFVFGKNGKTLKEHLVEIFKDDGGPSQVKINWTMFGSSDLTKQPDSIRKSFLWRKSELDKHTKAFMRRKDLREYDIHMSDVKGETVIMNDRFQMNHYAIMSREYFEKIKMTRGDSTIRTATKPVRDWDYFRRYDFKEEIDTTLRDLVN
jgi:hypothetical protein